MPKKKRPRKPKPAPIGPPKAIKDFADSYRCSHCRSNVDGIVKDPSGFYRLMVCHDYSCPVLRGTLTDMPDAVRAAVAVGNPAMVIDDPLDGGAADESTD
jgi:hypothetical protein